MKNIETNEIAEIIGLKFVGEEMMLHLVIDRRLGECSGTKRMISAVIPVNEVSSTYKIGTLLKFSPETPVEFVPIPTTDFDYREFQALVLRIPNRNCEQLIEMHQSLIDRKDEGGTYDGMNYCELFMTTMLNFEYDHNETPELIKFFNSKHTSDFFKQMVKDKVKEPTKIVSEAINSERPFSDFTEDEFDSIYESMQSLIKENGAVDFSFMNIVELAFRLDSKGAIGFLNNKVHHMVVINHILEKSGVPSTAIYREPTALKGDALNKIYAKLYRLDPKKAESMSRMTMAMHTLDAGCFITSLIDLADNGYYLDKTTGSYNNKGSYIKEK